MLFVAGIDGSSLHYRVHQKIEQLGLFGFRCVLRRYSDPRIERELDRSEAVIVYRSPATRELLRAPGDGMPAGTRTDQPLAQGQSD